MTVQEIIEKINEIDGMIEACESERVLDFDDYNTMHAILEEQREDLLKRDLLKRKVGI